MHGDAELKVCRPAQGAQAGLLALLLYEACTVGLLSAPQHPCMSCMCTLALNPGLVSTERLQAGAWVKQPTSHGGEEAVHVDVHNGALGAPRRRLG